jgi:cytochrome c
MLQLNRARVIARPAVMVMAACLGIAGLSRGASAADTAENTVSFDKDIKPILTKSCVNCHKQDPRNPRGPAGGLRLDDKEAAMKGGKTGNDIVPGKAEESLVYKVLTGPVKVSGKEIHQMPKARPNQTAKPLAKEQVELIKKWIDQGANWSK